MNIPKDKQQHALGGLAVILCTVVLLLIDYHFGHGAALAASTTMVGIGIEINQKIRGEGTPEVMDAVYTAAPGWVVWAFLALKGIA